MRSATPRKSFLTAIVLFVISLYRRFVSPLLPRACRFYPTCSCYAAEAIERYGAMRGVVMALKRVGRCHPLSPGGQDPVR